MDKRASCTKSGILCQDSKEMLPGPAASGTVHHTPLSLVPSFSKKIYSAQIY